MCASPRSGEIRAWANPFAALTEYELRNLVAHLDAAGRHEQLHRVLALTTGEGRNAWYEAQLASGDAEDYVADVAVACPCRPSLEHCGECNHDQHIDAVVGSGAARGK